MGSSTLMSSRYSAIRVFVLAVVLGLVTACGLSGCSGLTSASSSPKPAAGALAANPSSVVFGNVTLGSNATQSVSLTNSGNAPLTVSSVSATGGGFSWNGMSLPVTLAAGQGTNFNAVFTPTASGSASGTISIASNAPGSPASIALGGTGVQGQLTASSVSVSFGNVLVGGNSAQTQR